MRIVRGLAVGLWAILALAAVAAPAQAAESERARLDRLEANVVAAEDISAIEKVQRSYGYFLDKGLWEDVADLFADDAIGDYPAGVFVGKASIREHLYKNIGLGPLGLQDGRLYNHMMLQPVVHLDPGGQTAKGRWRAFAMIGHYGGTASWAEGVYEFTYVKVGGFWKIKTLTYYSGFGAPYEGGWIKATPFVPGAAPAPSHRPPLAHPADRQRPETCPGYPAACLLPFHYAGTPPGGPAWTTVDVTGHAAAADLVRRAQRLADEQAIQNLQDVYGYYIDQGRWGQAADLFSRDGTIEVGLQGVYLGQDHIRRFLALTGPEGLKPGQLNDHLQLQPIVDIAPDGRMAYARVRDFGMIGVFNDHGTWTEGVGENVYVKEGGVWRIKALRYYPTMIVDYDKGWDKDAQPAPGPSAEFPPDRPPTDVYAIYPKPYTPPYHFNNPPTGRPLQYPDYPTKLTPIAMDTAPAPTGGAPSAAAIAEAERQVDLVKDYDEIENLEGAYGYYVDKNLWNDVADLFAPDSTMELAQRGVYVGQDHIRRFLTTAFGPEGPQANRLGNHIQLQPVIDVAPDGESAKIRIRLLQQLGSPGGRGGWGAGVYENEVVKQDGVWMFKSLHAFNTWTAEYDGGWAKAPGGYLPGPSKTDPPDRPPTVVFQMYPNPMTAPFHYANPVTGTP